MSDFKLLSLSHCKDIFHLFLVSICKILRVQQHSLKRQNPFRDSLHFLCQNNETFFYTFLLWIYIRRCKYHNRFIYSFCSLDFEKLDILAWNTVNPRKWIKVNLSYVIWWKHNGNNISTLRGEKLITWMVARDNEKYP